MSAWERPRLAPWRGEDGKPCFLVAADDGFLARLADDVEAELLTIGADLLVFAEGLLNEANASDAELRFLARRLSEALRDALLVAESRGGRLPARNHDGQPVGWNQRRAERAK